MKSAGIGTFIVRFSAPNPDVSVSYVNKNKSWNQNTNVSHVKLVRIDKDSYEKSIDGNMHRDNLRGWIKNTSEFQYLYTNTGQIVSKNEYFK